MSANPDAPDGPSAELMLPIGGLFGHYRVIELLGRGALGDVFRAEDTRLGRRVALKVLRVGRDNVDGSSTNEQGARILREARAAATIDHPNAVAIYDVGELDGIPYLVMELIPGKSLRDIVGDPQFTVERRVRWMIELASALHAAHERGVVHQDIKPENVMLRSDDIIKVLDFGIARRILEDAPPSEREDPGRVYGTPAYMAPERLRGAKGNAATDQFTWGVLAYELLAGKYPWGDLGDGDATGDAVERPRDVPRPPSAHEPGLPAAVDGVVLRALSKDPADRYASMAVVGDALTDAWSGAANAAAEADRRRRRRDGLALSGMFVAAAVAVTSLSWSLGHIEPAPVARVQPARVSQAKPPDFGSTMSTNADALAAYRVGVEEMRNGAASLARKDLERATELDPSFAAAHLRKLFTSIEASDDDRAHLLKAIQFRDTLSDHDRGLLHAIEPWLGIPQDIVEVERRLVALTAAQHDADYLYQLCRFHVLGGKYEQAIDACRVSRELDPTAASAFWMEGLSRIQLGDLTGGTAALDKCLGLAPKATSCLHDFLQISSRQGSCDVAFGYADRLVKLDPSEAEWQRQLGYAEYATGKSLEAVRAALEASSARMPPDQIVADRAMKRARLAILVGDFATARKELDRADRAVATSALELDHAALFEIRAHLARETGREKELLPRAREFLRSRAAWTPSPEGDMSFIASIVRYRIGDLLRKDFLVARMKWLALESERPQLPGRSGLGTANRWLIAYGDSVMTLDDANEAAVALSKGVSLPSERVRSTELDERVGATYLAADRRVEAARFLRRAASSCEAVVYPMHHTWANLELGKAIELEDRPGACAAFKVVIDRWGSAKESRSAAEARARRAALGCR